MKISIVIPCFNEEGNVKDFRKELFPYIKDYDYEVLFVDDGSIDNTYNELLKLKNSKKDSKIKIVRHKKNLGLGSAIKTGIKSCTGDVIITLDADMTFHPKYIKDLVNKYIETRADCVIGSYQLGQLSKNIPLYRKILSKGVNKLYNLVLGKKITSVSPMFRLYKTSDVKNMHIESKDFNVNAEILFNLIKNNKSILEVPVTLGIRKKGVSKINNFREIINHSKLLIIIGFWRLKTFIKFSISSIIGVLVNLLLTFTLTELVFGRPQYFYAYIIGLSVGLLTQFAMHTIYTFNNKDFMLRKLLLFFGYAILMSFLQAYVVKRLTESIGVDYYLLVIIGVIVFFYMLGYFINRKYVFKT